MGSCWFEGRGLACQRQQGMRTPKYPILFDPDDAVVRYYRSHFTEQNTVAQRSSKT